MDEITEWGVEGGSHPGCTWDAPGSFTKNTSEPRHPPWVSDYIGLEWGHEHRVLFLSQRSNISQSENRQSGEQREAGLTSCRPQVGSRTQRRRPWEVAVHGMNSALPSGEDNRNRENTHFSAVFNFTNFPVTMSESRNNPDVGIKFKSWFRPLLDVRLLVKMFQLPEPIPPSFL